MKRIVICADGTWNVRDQIDDTTGKRRPTNVTKLARAVLPRDRHGVDQVVCYLDGIGTGGSIDRLSGGAFGRGMEENIRVLYRFVVYNYVDGDELYFFGFSRGAFTIRTLAGFMAKVGLIKKDDDYYVPELYACYENGIDENSESWKQAFRKTSSREPCPPIRLIGVWDTVGALGAPGLLGQAFNRDKYKYHDVGLNDSIQNAVHALAIDERRKPFLPTMWVRPASWQGKLVQAWFAGVHSNIGGGLTPDGLANEALHWVVEHAEQLGLALDAGYLNHFTPCFNSKLHDSMTTMYRLMGSMQRPIGEHLPDGETVHQSAIDRMEYAPCAYKPENLVALLSGRMSGAPTFSNTTRLERGVPCP